FFAFFASSSRSLRCEFFLDAEGAKQPQSSQRLSIGDSTSRFFSRKGAKVRKGARVFSRKGATAQLDFLRDPSCTPRLPGDTLNFPVMILSSACGIKFSLGILKNYCFLRPLSGRRSPGSDSRKSCPNSPSQIDDTNLVAA